jgi:hypothetical protein
MYVALARPEPGELEKLLFFFSSFRFFEKSGKNSQTATIVVLNHPLPLMK